MIHGGGGGEGRAVTTMAYRHLTFSLPSTTTTRITARNSDHVENNQQVLPMRRADAAPKSSFLYILVGLPFPLAR